MKLQRLVMTYSPGTSPVRYSGTSERSNRPSGKKILLSGPANHYHMHHNEWTIWYFQVQFQQTAKEEHGFRPQLNPIPNVRQGKLRVTHHTTWQAPHWPERRRQASSWEGERPPSSWRRVRRSWKTQRSMVPELSELQPWSSVLCRASRTLPRRLERSPLRWMPWSLGPRYLARKNATRRTNGRPEGCSAGGERMSGRWEGLNGWNGGCGRATSELGLQGYMHGRDSRCVIYCEDLIGFTVMTWKMMALTWHDVGLGRSSCWIAWKVTSKGGDTTVWSFFG